MNGINDEVDEGKIMKSLIDKGFEVSGGTEITSLTKSQYLDNGYGNYFDAQTEVTISLTRNVDGKIIDESIEEIKVDNETEEQIDAHISGCMKNCICRAIFNECFETLDEKEISLLKRVMRQMGLTTDELECGECDTLGMKKSWIEQVRYG